VPGSAPRESLASWDSGTGQWLDANGTSGDLFGQSEPFSGRWPPSGMTRSGRLFQRPKPAPPTAGNGSSSVPGLPTPNASDWKGSGETQGRQRDGRPRGRGDADLPEAVVTLLRTPDSYQGSRGGSQHPARRKAGGHQPSLEDQVTHLMAAPARIAEMRRAGHGVSNLHEEVLTLLPTVAAHDSGNTPENHLRKKPGRSQVTSLQVIVEHGLITTGGRTVPRSGGGKPSSGGQLPGQLSLDELDGG
jgi:hypothetical protein